MSYICKIEFQMKVQHQLKLLKFQIDEDLV
jgi:hypothetical protein